jgi:hypothetical protein
MSKSDESQVQDKPVVTLTEFLDGLHGRITRLILEHMPHLITDLTEPGVPITITAILSEQEWRILLHCIEVARDKESR